MAAPSGAFGARSTSGWISKTMEIRVTKFTTSESGDPRGYPNCSSRARSGRRSRHGRQQLRNSQMPRGNHRPRCRRHHPAPQEREALKARHRRCGRTKRSPPHIKALRADHLATMEGISMTKQRRTQDALRQDPGPTSRGSSTKKICQKKSILQLHYFS